MMDWIQGGKKEDFSVTPSFLASGNWVGLCVCCCFFGEGKGEIIPDAQEAV